MNVRLCARIQPLLPGHKYRLFLFLRAVCWSPMQTQNLYIRESIFFLWEEPIEAWDFGPVVPEVFEEYERYGGLDIPTIT